MIIASRVNNIEYNQKPPLKSRINFCGPKAPKAIPVDAFQSEVQEQLGNYVNRYNYRVKKPVQWRIKRALDYTAASAGIVATSPVMLATAVAIKLDSKGPVIFKQARVGKGGKTFTMYKFRSMVVHEPSEGNIGKVKNDPRITRVGRFIRKYSIDELPQLFNILKGDMSLVGPRPMAIREHHRFVKEEPSWIRRYSTSVGAILAYPRKSAEIVTPKQYTATEKAYLENWNIGKDIRHFFGTLRDVITGRNL